MHRNQSFGTQLQKSLHRLFRVHVNFTAGGRVISSDGKQSQLDIKAVADFFEAGEISGIAAVKNRAAVRSDHKSAEIPMQIRKEPGTPMATWRKRNLERAKLDCLPVIEFMHDAEP